MLTFHPSRAPGYGTTTYAHTPDGEATYTVSPWGRGWELHVTRWQGNRQVEYAIGGTYPTREAAQTAACEHHR
jgi:hypothetical protein